MCVHKHVHIYVCVYVEREKSREGGGERKNESFSAFSNNDRFPSSVFHKICPEVLRYWRVLGFPSTATSLKLWQLQMSIYISEILSVLTIKYHQSAYLSVCRFISLIYPLTSHYCYSITASWRIDSSIIKIKNTAHNYLALSLFKSVIRQSGKSD